ncbi:MAG: acyltransferase [Armatimonadetes bacterium]|nr:acyltransferase [Armatimonadota bacterium]
MSQGHGGVIRPLAGFRAVAALWVVVVHIESLHPPGLPESALRFLRGYGVLPVVFFFILSGFILSLVYHHRAGGGVFDRDGVKKYGWARFGRIVPLYAASLVPGIAFHLVWTVQGGANPMPFTQSTAPGEWSLFRTDGWAFNALFRSNVPAWTLSAELLFYILFPFLLPRLMDWDRGQLRRGVVWSLALYGAIQVGLGFLQLLGHGWIKQVGFGVGHFGSPIFVPAFFAGMCLGTLVSRGWIWEWVASHSDWVYAGIVAWTVILAQVPNPTWPPSMVTAFLAPAFCLAIAAGVGGQGWVNSWLSCRAVQELGAASYAIYITHWPTKELMQFYFNPVGWPGITPGLAVLAAVLAVGFAGHELVEKPLHAWVRARTG